MLDAAEGLFALHGVNSVSMRAISVAAGQANNSAVQYHFGSKDGLIHAIFERRALAYEQDRIRALAKLDEARQTSDTRALLGIILLPLAKQNDIGAYNYASVLKQLHESDRYREQREVVAKVAPITSHVIGLLKQATGMPDEIFWYRLHHSSLTFIQCILNPEAGYFGEPAPFQTWDQKVRAALAAAEAGLMAWPARRTGADPDSFTNETEQESQE